MLAVKAAVVKEKLFVALVMVVGFPPLMVYKMLNGAVPVRLPVMVAVEFAQIGPLLLITTVGLGLIVTVVVATGKEEAEQ